MKSTCRFIAFALALAAFVPMLTGCNNEPANTTVNTTAIVTEPVLYGEPLEVSSEGKVEWTVLGVQNRTEFAGMTAEDGDVFAIVYLEARNKSLEDTYILKTCMDTGKSTLIEIPDDKLPKGYTNLGGPIASGTRKLFCLCFERKAGWYNIVLTYNPFNGQNTEMILLGADYEVKKEIDPGNTAYPVDPAGPEVLLQDLAALYDRYYALQWGTPKEATAKKLEEKIVQKDDGIYFSDVNYNSNRTASWETETHLTNLKNLISAYGEEKIKNDPEARETVIALLDLWLTKDYTCTVNWYPNEIATPRNLASIGIMLKPYLTDAQIEKMDEIIGRGTLRGSSKVDTYTGANLLDTMSNTVMHALFIGDPDLALAGVARIADEVRIAKSGEEGMQEDGSYFQHGNLLCAAGSYGSVFVNRVSEIIANLHGTIFAFPEENTKIFIDHLLDGQCYFHRALGTTYFSIGRSAVYANGANQILTSLKRLAKLDGIYRKGEIEKQIASYTDHSQALTGLKYFPLSYTLISTCPDYHIGVRGAHKNIILTEVVSDQNQLGYNLSYGSNTSYMYYGDEYQAIGAVMDLSMFPGTTAYHETKEQLQKRYDTGYKKTWGKTTYAGVYCNGATDGEKGLGALYMDLRNDGLYGKLSFITYDGGMIALGANIRCAKGANQTEIRTVIDQCKLNAAAVGGTPLNVNSGSTAVQSGTVVTNGAFAYYALDGSTLTANAVSLTDSYRRNDPAGSNQLQTADVFQLYISHGEKPKNASYAYAVTAVPDGNAPQNASDLPIVAITNTEALQAVEFKNGSAVIIFHAPGSYTLASGETVTAKQGEIVIR